MQAKLPTSEENFLKKVVEEWAVHAGRDHDDPNLSLSIQGDVPGYQAREGLLAVSRPQRRRKNHLPAATASDLATTQKTGEVSPLSPPRVGPSKPWCSP
jgi:hypothetical protein